jgi:alkyl sulfatase BDS1-like metallo-beta-lactamase superfamily hydrolase
VPSPRDPSVSPHVTEGNARLRAQLPFDDEQDYEDARRGRIDGLDPALIEATDGRIIWDLSRYSFLDSQCPETANPSAWRQAQLVAIGGLFEVAEGIYQVRGQDISNMTVVEGERGVLVIDPLISSECAAAALGLYRRHRGERTVTGLLYTHTHVDHFGGARGVLDPGAAERGDVPVLAPEHFLEHAISENVFAGPAMGRRAEYMFGAPLEPGPAGQIGASIGMGNSTGSVTLIPPNLQITRTGQTEVIDGIELSFQLTPGTEAPAEMNFLLPAHGALCIAENATHNLHNLLTLRGAPVRDPLAWSRFLQEAIDLFADSSEVMFAGHHWPRWGRERIVGMLTKQRDLYRYLHDQTLRLLNQGYVAEEAAEQLELPPQLATEWHCRGHYGSVNHNAKAIYQRYLGYFDGNPAHLWRHPPEPVAQRYVSYMGGADAVLERAKQAFEEGDFRWVAEVVSHVVFADPGNADARELEARALEQLAYGAENLTWRNFFLMGAKELREGIAKSSSPIAAGAGLIAHLESEKLIDAIAMRLDGPRAAEHELDLLWSFPDVGERHLLRVGNGVLTHRSLTEGADSPEGVDATLIVDRSAFDELVLGRVELPELVESGRLRVEGDGEALLTFFGLLDELDPAFPIVTP